VATNGLKEKKVVSSYFIFYNHSRPETSKSNLRLKSFTYKNAYNFPGSIFMLCIYTEILISKYYYNDTNTYTKDFIRNSSNMDLAYDVQCR
jgi:hypothetical protein